jgi:hypothetical protein
MLDVGYFNQPVDFASQKKQNSGGAEAGATLPAHLTPGSVVSPLSRAVKISGHCWCPDKMLQGIFSRTFLMFRINSRPSISGIRMSEITNFMSGSVVNISRPFAPLSAVYTSKTFEKVN